MDLAERGWSFAGLSKRSRQGIVASIITVSVIGVMLACGGTTASLPAGCTGTVANNGCYGVVKWTNSTDFSGNVPNGAYTSEFLAPMTCSGTCGSTGEFLANYIMLVRADGHRWASVGYRIVGATDLEFYDGYQFDDTSVHFTNIGAVGASDASQYANFALNRLQYPGGAAFPYGWVPRIKTQTTSYAPPVLVAAGANFTAGWLEMGEFVHGTHDIAANTTFFNHNRFTANNMTSWITTPPDIGVAGWDQTNFIGIVATNGTVSSANPPYAAWFDEPNGSGILHQSGGNFDVECCTPL
jgi:hypothetical protein